MQEAVMHILFFMIGWCIAGLFITPLIIKVLKK